MGFGILIAKDDHLGGARKSFSWRKDCIMKAWTRSAERRGSVGLSRACVLDSGGGQLIVECAAGSGNGKYGGIELQNGAF